MKKGFRKTDGGKARISLFPPSAYLSICKVLTYGAAKYETAEQPGAENWHRVDDPRRYYDALLRHVYSRMSGERTDPESGLPHLAHAGCCLVFLLAFEAKGVETVQWETWPDSE